VNLQDVLIWAFRQNYHADCMNAAVHTAPVRYSPLTFRLAEHIAEQRRFSKQDLPSPQILPEVYAVLIDLGEYEEDPGR
jgi:hypothetical protein